ncbi:MAG: hypothetical protein PHN31_05455 [Candidatus Gracilibacteria bacterium]|nr:hypothetical protein [Candidatus Gracilibacteria bacterium]
MGILKNDNNEIGEIQPTGVSAIETSRNNTSNHVEETINGGDLGIIANAETYKGEARGTEDTIVIGGNVYITNPGNGTLFKAAHGG